MPDSADDLTIRYVGNLSYFSDALCCFWIKEIHIDKCHEKQHYRFFLKVLANGKGFKEAAKQLFWTVTNNIWDMFDCFKMALQYPKAFLHVLIADLFVLGLVAYFILKMAGVI